jgi:hypothetical protein
VGGWLVGWMDGLLDGWMDGWIDGWMDRRIDRQTDIVYKIRQFYCSLLPVLLTFPPSYAERYQINPGYIQILVPSHLKSIQTNLSNVPGKDEIRGLQIIAVWGTAHILRNVLM